MARDEPLTPEQFHKIGDEAYELGYQELGDLFHSTADTFALWNEHHTRTVKRFGKSSVTKSSSISSER
jgi:hypothetical protein